MIKQAKGSIYAEVLRDLKENVKPDALDVKIRGVRETRKGEILIEVDPATDGRTKLSSAIREVVGVGSSVRELVPRTEVEVLNLDTITGAAEVTEALCNHFGGVRN